MCKVILGLGMAIFVQSKNQLRPRFLNLNKLSPATKMRISEAIMRFGCKTTGSR